LLFRLLDALMLRRHYFIMLFHDFHVIFALRHDNVIHAAAAAILMPVSL